MSIQHLQVGKRVQLEVVPIFQIYHDNGYGIYNCEVDELHQLVIKGNFPIPLHLNQVYTIDGKVVAHKSDKQIDVLSYESSKPKGAHKVINYLQQLNGLKKRAELIYQHFGDQSIEVLKKHPERVSQIKGIGEKRALRWQEELLAKEKQEKDTLYLLGLGLSGKQAAYLIQEYKSSIRQRIEQNPYILLSAKGNSSFGFLKCDELARKIGFDFAHPQRVKEGVLYCLKNVATRDGHTFLPKEKLIEEVNEVLGVRLTFTQMRLIASGTSDEFTLHNKTYKIDREDLEKRVKKIDSLQKESAKEKYRYPLFSIESHMIEKALDELVADGRIIVHSNRVALTWYEQEEQFISEEIFRLSKEQNWSVPVSIEMELEKYLKETGFTLEEKQREAVLEFAKRKGGCHLLIGSAGTGKTFTLKIILAILERVMKKNKEPFKVKVLAPTGKASKVAAKATGYPTETVHRGLEYHPELGFQRNQMNPLEETVVVVDEFSMMDVSLTAALLEAILSGTKVIFMGDIKQLPSVGAGNVLRDLVNSPHVHKVILEVTKRQGELSGLNKNANAIIAGKMMETCEDTKDAYILHEEDPFAIQSKILASIQRLMQKHQYDFGDIQVLSPQKRGIVGVYELNRCIQNHFNPQSYGEKIKNIHSDKVELFFQKGDKVIHIRNNYNKPWYGRGVGDYVEQGTYGVTNGETGIIEEIRTQIVVDEKGNPQKTQRIVVKYEDGYVFYDGKEEFKELDHAYCLSIHKSQGSQWKAVIIPVASQHAFFLDRNLIYTAWTRAMMFGVMIGSKKTVAMSIKKDKAIERYTQLPYFLEKQKTQKP